MSKENEAIKRWVEVFDGNWHDEPVDSEWADRAHQALAEMRQAIAEAEQPAQQNSPWCMKMNGCKTKCEDCPDEVARLQKREWAGLTADEMLEALTSVDPATQRLPVGFSRFACAIEAKLKEKNT